jgi:hypothetical protein
MNKFSLEKEYHDERNMLSCCYNSEVKGKLAHHAALISSKIRVSDLLSLQNSQKIVRLYMTS